MIEIIKPSSQAIPSLQAALDKANEAIHEASEKAEAALLQEQHSETVKRAGDIAARLGKRDFHDGVYTYDSGWLESSSMPSGEGVQLRMLRVDTATKRVCGIPVKRSMDLIQIYSRLYDKYTKWPDGSAVVANDECPVRFCIYDDETGQPTVQIADPASEDMTDPNFLTIDTEEQWLQINKLLESFEHHVKH